MSVVKPPVEISTLGQLINWYDMAPETNQPGMLMKDIVIDRTVDLGPIKGRNARINLGCVRGGLQVVSGGTLMIDNPGLVLEGAEKLLSVEGTGKLVLKRGDMAPTTVPDAVMVTLKDQGGFVLNAGFTGLPPNGVEDLRGQIPPSDDSALPENQKPDNPQKPGGSQKPDKSQQPDAQKSPGNSRQGEEPEIARVKLISVTASGKARVRLDFTGLPQDAGSIYIYTRHGGGNWEKAYYLSPGFDESGAPVLEKRYNFLVDSSVLERSAIQYQYQTDYKPVYFRARIVSPSGASTTDSVKLVMPETIRGGASQQFNHDEDGSAGGNRGGIQGMGTRQPRPVKPEKTMAGRGQAFQEQPETGPKVSQSTAKAGQQAVEGGSGSGMLPPGGNAGKEQTSLPADSHETPGPDDASRESSGAMDEKEGEAPSALSQKPEVPGESKEAPTGASGGVKETVPGNLAAGEEAIPDTQPSLEQSGMVQPVQSKGPNRGYIGAPYLTGIVLCGALFISKKTKSKP